MKLAFYYTRFGLQRFWSNGFFKLNNDWLQIIVSSCWHQCISACAWKCCNGAVVLVGKAFPGVKFHKEKFGERCSRKECIHTTYNAFTSCIFDTTEFLSILFMQWKRISITRASLVDWRVMVVYKTGHPISRPHSLKSVSVVRVEDVVYQKRNWNTKWISPSHFRCCKQVKGNSIDVLWATRSIHRWYWGWRWSFWTAILKLGVKNFTKIVLIHLFLFFLTFRYDKLITVQTRTYVYEPFMTGNDVRLLKLRR